MLRVGEHWHGSDVGRQRQGNEDSYFVRAPIFVVADGMGGAQAGEVASEVAVEAFRDGLPDDPPEQALAATIRAANRRIYEMARADSHRQGMGTTCTAAYVDDDDIVIAHVGDSRCYLLRGDDLSRLTRDHSLVGELVDRGRLTEEEAEVHPQRSVITRALGPEPDVAVDTERIAARAGDLVLICSDGLTSMVREPQLRELLLEQAPLERLGRSLIAAANEAGGRDNITVILFRLEEVRIGAGAPAGTDMTTEQAVLPEAGDDPGDGVTREAPAAAPRATARQEAEYRASGTVAVAAVPEASAPRRTAPLPDGAQQRRPGGPPPPRRRGRLRRMLAPLTVIGALLAIVLVSFWIAMRGVFFIGLDSNRAVAIYRGLPYELPGGIKLYTRDYTSGVTIDQVPERRRDTFTDHKLRSNSDAQDLVRQLEVGRIGDASGGAP